MVDQNKVIYGCIEPSAGITIKGMFNIRGPQQYIAYTSRSFTYFGKYPNNSFEGNGVYYDFEQYFTYIGGFRDSFKNGFGILLQYQKAAYEYRSADNISSATEFEAYSASLQKLIATQLDNWRPKCESFKTFVKKLEGHVGKGIIDKIREVCNKTKYEEINKLQPPRTTYTYIGELKDDQRDGFGISFLRNGDIYLGSYSKNKRAGFGMYLWSEANSKNGSTHYIGYHNNNAFVKYGAVYSLGEELYLGEIVNGSFNGRGKQVIGKTTYEGEFKQGKKHGFGKYETEDYKFEGLFDKDSANGDGIQRWNQFEFQGQFKDGVKVYKCEIVHDDKEVYKGDITDGVISGKGILNIHNNKYEGDFRDNDLEGKCKVTYKNGAQCDCTFVNGVRKGEAIITLPPDKGLVRGESKRLIFESDVATNI